MGASRQDVDLRIVLKDPTCARNWVAGCRRDYPELDTFITIDYQGRDLVIHFDKMTDEEAVIAAFCLLEDFEIPRLMFELDKLRGMELPSIH